MSNISHELTANHYLVTHDVGPNQNGVRLDNFLKDRYRRRSREQIKKAIDSGAITIRRAQSPHLTVGKLKPSYQLIPGDAVLVMSERKPEPDVCFDYKVIYEDDVLFVINKPANLPVHPSGRYFFNTLLTHLQTQNGRSPEEDDQLYYLVHRIDKETSGVLVLTKDKVACANLTKQFALRSTEKRYLAIVHGIPPETFEVDLAMNRHTNSMITLKMFPVLEADGGQPAQTSFRRLEVAGAYSLVECYPKTGRQHQIRVHLESAGFPIVGDKLYGMPESEALKFYEGSRLTPEAELRLILPRHALHAAGIHFNHPSTGKRMEIRSDLPQDLRDFLLKNPAPPLSRNS